MNELHLRPRTVTELVDAAFTLYRRHPLTYTVGAAIAIAPTLVVAMLFGPAAVSGAPFIVEIGGGAVGEMVNQTVGTLSYMLGIALMYKMGSEAYLGGVPDVAAALRHVVPLLPRLLWAGFLKGLLLILGALALLVGTLYVLARWFAVGPAIVIEGRSAIDAFERSTDLTRGRKRHVLNTLAFVCLVAGAIFFGLGLGIAIPLSFADDFLAGQIATVIGSVLTYPLLGLSTVVLYYDARIRGEGFDLEQMAVALEAPAATP
jgi:hypothetical protein